MSIGIYKYTNSINNKIYIGQSKNIEARIRAHKYESLNSNTMAYNYPLSRSLRKYGEDNFKIEIIEKCLKNELNNREKYWIKYYNSNDPKKGYNCTEGGEAGPSLSGEKNPKAKLLEQNIRDIRMRQRISLDDISIVYKEYANKISFSAFEKIWYGETWQDILPDSYKIFKENKNKSQVIFQLDLKTGEIIKTFLSAKEAALSMGAKDSNQITKVCRGDRKSYKGYSWCYSIDYETKVKQIIQDQQPKPKTHRILPNSRKVAKLNKDTLEVLTVYNSLSLAGEDNNCDSSSIGKVCRGIKQTCKGFKWRYVDD